MLISIITSVYNCEKYISEMIDSVLAQTYTDWELIIIDDASTDRTWNIIFHYQDARIKKYRNKKKQGLTVNLNNALDKANGMYIARIDGDDIAYPRRLEKQVEFMNQHPDVVLSGCWMNGFGTQNLPMQNTLDSEIMSINLLFNTIVFHPTFIIRKSVLDLYQIKYNENLTYAQDYDMEYQLSKYGKVKNIPEVLMKYRFHNKQVTVEKLEELKRCASVTRRLILDELGIRLSTEEYEIWDNFGTFDYVQEVENEIEHVENIIKKIISINKIKRIYKEVLLQEILSSRLELFKSGQKSISKKNINDSDLEEKNKYHKLFLMMAQWKRLSKQGVHVDSFFIMKRLYKVAIYGMGDVGRLLLEELNNTQITVEYGIDRNIGGTFINMDGIPIVTPKDNLKNVDAIIVTAISQYESIKKMLERKIKCPIWSIEDVIYSI